MAGKGGWETIQLTAEDRLTGPIKISDGYGMTPTQAQRALSWALRNGYNAKIVPRPNGLSGVALESRGKAY